MLQAGGFTTDGDVATWADVGGGPGLRDGGFKCYWVTLPRGLTWAAGACFEAAALLPLATWPAVIGRRADSGGGRGP